MRDFSGRRAGLYRANSLGRATAEANGVGLAGWSRRFICSGRRVVALPGFHQPLLLSAEIYRQPARLTSVGFGVPPLGGASVLDKARLKADLQTTQSGVALAAALQSHRPRKNAANQNR